MRVEVRHSFPDRDNPIEYTFETLLWSKGVSVHVSPKSETQVHVGIEDTMIAKIHYGPRKRDHPTKNSIQILASDFFGPRYLTPDSLPGAPVPNLHYPGFGDIPVPYSGQIPPDRVGETLLEDDSTGLFVDQLSDSGCIVSNLDLVASSFFLVSRYEEHFAVARDRHGRFESRSSALGLWTWSAPVVNKYLEMLWKWIEMVSPVDLPMKEVYPSGRKAAVCVTHDVDMLHGWDRGGLSSKVRGRLKRVREAKGAGRFLSGGRGLISDLAAFLKGRNPYWTVPEMLEKELERGLKPTFFLMAAPKGEGPFPPDYDTEDDDLELLVGLLKKSGCEISLHGSYRSHSDCFRLISERSEQARVVGKESAGIRQHLLRLKIPETYRVQAAAGFAYDSTLGFAEREGFRAGFCHPFMPYDLFADRSIPIWEIPMIVMDRTLYAYRKYTPEEAYGSLLRLIEEVKRYNGVLVINWHNSTLPDLQSEGWDDFYEKMLDLLSAKDLHPTDLRGMVDIWESLPGIATPAMGSSKHSDQPAKPVLY